MPRLMSFGEKFSFWRVLTELFFKYVNLNYDNFYKKYSIQNMAIADYFKNQKEFLIKFKCFF